MAKIDDAIKYMEALRRPNGFLLAMLKEARTEQRALEQKANAVKADILIGQPNQPTPVCEVCNQPILNDQGIMRYIHHAETDEYWHVTCYMDVFGDTSG